MKAKIRVVSNIPDDYNWKKLEKIESKIVDYIFQEFGIVLQAKGDMLISGGISKESAVNLLKIVGYMDSTCNIADVVEELNDEIVGFGGISFDN